MWEYKVYGPYPVTEEEYPVRNGKRGRPRMASRYSVPSSDAHEFDRIKSSYGCYVFATKWSDSFKPWYVGKTTRTFEKEIFTPHKIAKLDDLRDFQERGSLHVFLIAPEKGRGAKNSTATDNMETFLVGACHRANSQLLNLKKLPKSAWAIVGVTKAKKGARTEGEKALQEFVGG